MTMAAGPTDDGGAPISSLPPARPSARPRICLVSRDGHYALLLATDRRAAPPG